MNKIRLLFVGGFLYYVDSDVSVFLFYGQDGICRAVKKEKERK
jgi:hypothetical protein